MGISGAILVMLPFLAKYIDIFMVIETADVAPAGKLSCITYFVGAPVV